MGLVGKDTKLAGCVDILECYKKKHAPLDSGDVSPLIYTVNRKEEVYNNINGSKMNPLHINLYSSVVIDGTFAYSPYTAVIFMLEENPGHASTKI